MPAENRPGRSGYLIAAVLAIAGFAGGVALVVNLLSNLDADVRFVAPGSQDFTVRKPGTQIIWNDYRTVYGGRSFDLPEKLPDGVQIRVFSYDGTSGRPVDVVPNRGASSKTSEADRVSIASFEALAPGRYSIVIDGDFPERVFSVGPNLVLKILGTIFTAIGLSAIGVAAGLALAIWTFLRRNPSAPVPSTAAAGAPPAATGQASPVVAVTVTPEETARQVAIAVYALQAASFLVVVSMVAGVILNYVKREDVAGTWLESHYTWQIRTFWWWLVWMIVAAVLAIIVVGIAVALVNQIWLLYRIIKGWLRLSERKPMYPTA
jgi:uncharacterized membrane protein